MGDFRKGSAERASLNQRFVVKTHRTKSEDMGASRNNSANPQKHLGRQIGTNRNETVKSEQIGATPFWLSGDTKLGTLTLERQLDVRHPWQLTCDRCDRALYGGFSAIPLLYMKSPRKSASTRVAQQAHVCNKLRWHVCRANFARNIF